MKIIGESMVPKNPGYFHLAYTAAASPIPDPQKGLLTAGLILVGGGVLLLRRIGTLAVFSLLVYGTMGFLAGGGLLFLLGLLLSSGFFTGAPASVIVMMSGSVVVLGALAFRWLSCFFGGKVDPDWKKGGRGLLAGKLTIMLGFVFVLAGFLFGRPQYQHPEWMTSSRMRGIAGSVDTALAGAISEDQWFNEPEKASVQSVEVAFDTMKRLDSRDFEDGWNRPMTISPGGEKNSIFCLVSAGADGVISTPDDIIGTAKRGFMGKLEISLSEHK